MSENGVLRYNELQKLLLGVTPKMLISQLRELEEDKLIKRKNNGLIKVITGIRRCGKSYLLNTIFTNYLLSIGVDKSHIIFIELDDEKNEYLLEKRKLRE